MGTDSKAIDWSKLTHVYGPATDVPELLEAFLDGGDDVSGRAFQKLISSLYHQSDVTDATAMVALVLGEELSRADGGRRAAECLELLSLFAQAAGSFGVTDAATAEKALENVEGGTPIEGRFGSLNEPLAADAVWGALRRVLPHVGPYLSAADPETIEAAAAFLAEVGVEASSLFPMVRSVADRPCEDPAARAAVLSALFLTAPTQADSNELIGLLEASLQLDDERVRAVAAYGLAVIQGADLGEEAFEILVNAALNEEFPGYLPERRIDSVTALVAPRQRELLLSALKRCTDFFTAIQVVGYLLESASENPTPYASSFGRDDDGVPNVPHSGPTRTHRESVPEDEVEIWSAVVDSEVIWRGRTDLFEKLGLPESREGLRKLLKGSSVSPRPSPS